MNHCIRICNPTHYPYATLPKPNNLIEMNKYPNILSQLKNGYNAQKSIIKLLNCKDSVQFLNFLKDHGFIKAWFTKDYKELNVHLRYVFAIPSIKKITCFSRPSIPTIISFKDLCRLRNSPGILVLSTPYGLISHKTAISRKIGGDLLAYIH